MTNNISSVSLLGVRVNNEKEDKVLEFIIKGLKNPKKKGYLVTMNPEILVLAQRNSKFRRILNDARLGLPDGIGVILGGKFLGKKFPERVTGADLVEKLCKEASREGLVIGFLGGRSKIAERTSECLRQKYPTLRVGFAQKEWGKGPDRPLDILFVAFGFPKQEFWMAENLDRIPVRIAIGVGGAFDFISGAVPRAPKWVQARGFEWFFRLLVQPWRIRRQAALPIFIYMVLREKVAFLFGKSNTG